VADNYYWIIYAIFSAFLILWWVWSAWTDKSQKGKDVRAALVILGTVFTVILAWQFVGQ
jgi:hypothetical protein